MDSILAKSSIVFVTYSILSLVNLYYLFAWIIKLEHKSFHLLMCMLIQISYTAYIVEWAIIYH